jgi:hypothetical protein
LEYEQQDSNPNALDNNPNQDIDQNLPEVFSARKNEGR